jgi:hypothetical protein
MAKLSGRILKPIHILIKDRKLIGFCLLAELALLCPVAALIGRERKALFPST